VAGQVGGLSTLHDEGEATMGNGAEGAYDHSSILRPPLYYIKMTQLWRFFNAPTARITRCRGATLVTVGTLKFSSEFFFAQPRASGGGAVSDHLYSIPWPEYFPLRFVPCAATASIRMVHLP
jgi:hypothetical protein